MKEKLNTITHLIGVVFALSSIWMVWPAVYRGWEYAFGVLFFIVGMFLMFLASTIYHWVPQEHSTAKGVLRRLDHISIYVMIACSYTPICVSVIGGWLGWLVFGLQWAVVIGGVFYKVFEEEKTVLVDTIWTPHRFDFVENLKKEVDLHKIDFIVANHGECDHSGSLTALMDEIPDTPIYCTANAVKSIEGQYGKRGWNFHVVKTGDSVDIGNGKKLVFVEMRMLHWPDSMATFMTGDNILFSNDAFGQHYAVEDI